MELERVIYFDVNMIVDFSKMQWWFHAAVEAIAASSKVQYLIEK